MFWRQRSAFAFLQIKTGGRSVSSTDRQSALRPAVFLDRDGTLIDNAGDLGDPDQLKILPGVAQALQLLLKHNFMLFVVTNQGGVARGKYNEEAVLQTHARLEQMLRAEVGTPTVITEYYYCPFHPQGTVENYRREHEWRKPAPGMLFAAALAHAIDLGKSWMIGDQERDVFAGAAAQCRTILISSDREMAAASVGDFVEKDLLHAARRITAPVIDAAAIGSVALHARRSDILSDAVFKETIKSMAHALAQRTGIQLLQIDFHTNSVTATVEGGEVIALGFATELRRDTDRWWRSHRAPESPWGSF
jgi:D-glycero-D-manno-heptose 1,7-bisphosphate phosphatase